MKVAINGFGRIGREIFRINLEKNYFDIVAINDLGNTETMSHLLKYDSNYGVLPNEVEVQGNDIVVDGKTYKVLSERDPEQLPWAEMGVDLVIEATGVFRTREAAGKHITAGAKKVVISAPAKDEIDFTVVLGVNEQDYDPATHHIISNASCTTNCLAPVAKIINDEFGIEQGLMTTIHAYTNDQKLLDLPHPDMRRARAAGMSMIPTSTGAAKAVSLVIPELKGKLSGMAVRVPTSTVSLVDLTVNVSKETTTEEVNAKFQAAAEGPLKNILNFTTKPLVSIDYKGDPHSSTIDGLSTEVISGKMVKVLSWYDNEWGYASRVVDLVKIVGDKA